MAPKAIREGWLLSAKQPNHPPTVTMVTIVTIKNEFYILLLRYYLLPFFWKKEERREDI